MPMKGSTLEGSAVLEPLFRLLVGAGSGGVTSLEIADLVTGVAASTWVSVLRREVRRLGLGEIPPAECVAMSGHGRRIYRYQFVPTGKADKD